jgi:hypothetical protein
MYDDGLLTNRALGKETALMKWIGVTVVMAAVAEMVLGYAAPPSRTGAGVEDETATTTSAGRADIVTDEVTEQ